MRYADILNKIEADSEVSFERVGDTILIRKGKAQKPRAGGVEKGIRTYEPYVEREATASMREGKKYEDDGKTIKISFEEVQELLDAFSKLDERLASLEGELKNFRSELSHLRNTSLEKFYKKSYEQLGIETIQYPRAYDLVGEETLSIDRENELVKKLESTSEKVDLRMKEKPSFISKFGFITAPLITLYNFLSTIPFRKSEKVSEKEWKVDVYKEFQRKLFYLVRTGPRSLDEIAEKTGEDKINCMRWLRRMVDDGLLEELRSETKPRRIIYRIVWDKAS